MRAIYAGDRVRLTEGSGRLNGTVQDADKLLCEVLWDGNDSTYTYADWELTTICHCGDDVHYGYAQDRPYLHRGMCAYCDSVRCDAYPGECGR